MHIRRWAGFAASLTLLGACGDDGYSSPASDTAPASDTTLAEPAAPIDPGDGGDYSVTIDPTQFSTTVDNPFYPLAPGMKWVYEESVDGEKEITTVEVLDEPKTVMGVDVVVVHDVVTTEDGDVLEDTFDWFAQDADGNVWYFGETTTSYEDGTSSTKGSWEAGVDGALPGIVMPAEPQVSSTGYRQEYSAGAAEDLGQVIALDEAVSTPGGDFDDTVRTRDWNPLDPEVIEEKTYAAGVGFVYEVKTTGPDTGAEVFLVSFTTT